LGPGGRGRPCSRCNDRADRRQPREAGAGIRLRLPTSLHYSFDDGETWSENVLVDDRIGAYPSLVERKDGSILIVYFEEGAGSNVRARRFRVGPGGIEWLTFDGGAVYRRDDAPQESGAPSAASEIMGTFLFFP